MDLFDTPTPRVFTLPPSVAFLPALARTLHDSLGSDGFALADTIILLPTRRAGRALGEALLAVSGTGAMLLPAIRTLGDIDGDDPALADLADGLALPPAIDPLRRRLELARLIQARATASEGDWSRDPVAALNAADLLAALLDQAALAGDVDWSRLSGLVAEGDLAAHWAHSVTFLEIITTLWPAHLAAQGCVDPGTRQRMALNGLAARWDAHPPSFPVLVAGSTGTHEAVRTLMATVARLPRGAVVLPGLDTTMPDAAWAQAARDDQHPQRSMAQALATIGIARSDVAFWPGAREPVDARLRRTVLNEALTPAEATDDWRRCIDRIRTDDGPEAITVGLGGLSLCAASTEEEEASAIALTLRQTLESPQATAALITPDATLAARVAAKLQRWDIAVDVSAGRPLAATPAGSFLLHVLAWALDPADPIALCALLKHPLTRLGRDRPVVRDTAAALEINVLRAPTRVRSLEALIAAIQVKRERATWRPASQQTDAAGLISDLAAAGASLLAVLEDRLTLGALATALTATAEAISADRGGRGALWADDSGHQAAGFLADLIAHGEALGRIRSRDAGRLVEELMAGRVVRPKGSHPRLAILGPLEARLLNWTVTIIGGLDEGTWPATPAADPFLSRPMRTALGLPLPEQRIGLQAHDFVQLAAAPTVLMTRSHRRGDSPTVPSRWLWRLETLAEGAMSREEARARLHAVSGDWARRLAPNERLFDSPRARPVPRPPVAVRPRQFSATEIETWVRDPYGIYARKILGLKVLGALGTPIGAAERGTAVHDAVERLATQPSAALTEIEAQLETFLRESLGNVGYDGVALEGNLARLRPAIAAFARWESERRPRVVTSALEERGEIVLQTPDGPLTLSARADRIDVLTSGGVEIIDYKTGKPPTPKQVRTFLSSQLPVTGLIVRDGGFGSLGPRPVDALTYVRLGGKDAGPSDACNDAKVTTTPATLIEEALERLLDLAADYARDEQPYLSKPRAEFAGRWGDYDHLARRAEWASATDDPETGTEDSAE